MSLFGLLFELFESLSGRLLNALGVGFVEFIRRHTLHIIELKIFEFE